MASPFRIVTSFYPLQIMALNIASDIPDVTVENLAPPMTGCLHDFSLTPKQLQSLSGASVLIINGRGMEAFLEKVIRRYPNLPIIVASEGQGNPHVWMSVPLARKMVARIASQLAQLDKRHQQA